jgi:Protein of unknown function (DUF3592)
MSTFITKMFSERSWPSTNATVDTCQWLRLHDHLGGIGGHYRVQFTYEVAGTVNHGEFCHHGTQHIAPYTPGEHLMVQYDPKKPQRYHFAGAESNYEKLEAIVVVAVFALIAGYFLYAY